MKFEEQFPSLASSLVGDHRVVCVTVNEVEKHCLDKQRVKKIIFNGDVRGFEREIVEELIKEFDLNMEEEQNVK